MNISEHIDNFIQEMKRRNYAENTINVYSSNVKLFFEKSTKDHPKNINESDIKNFLSKFDEPNTQRSYHGAIKMFYEICLNQKDKFKYIPYCKKSSKLPIVLSQSEIQSMFNVCDNLKHRVIKMSCNIMNILLSLSNENMWNIFNKISFWKNLHRAIC